MSSVTAFTGGGIASRKFSIQAIVKAATVPTPLPGPKAKGRGKRLVVYFDRFLHRRAADHGKGVKALAWSWLMAALWPGNAVSLYVTTASSVFLPGKPRAENPDTLGQQYRPIRMNL
jgi:hypothetical protein